eukprot:GFYU01010228.1.p1 GENE.GFYU01010228.1~~GFYU01010228.1.p1  ORF type:complete len:409 (-),score=37.03 GFYU01010228.1:179-1273(-)
MEPNITGAAPWARPNPPAVDPNVTGTAPWVKRESSGVPDAPGGIPVTGKPAPAIAYPKPDPVPAQWHFKEPSRSIKSDDDITKFFASQAAAILMTFINDLNASVQGVRVSDIKPDEIPANCSKLVALLDTMDKWIEEIPPVEQPMRFGNKAYRDWYERLSKEITSLHASMLPEDLHPAMVELVPYYMDSFGNKTRIDYGTGHETAYLAWLACLHRVGFLTAADNKYVVLVVFQRYLVLMRKLQLVYVMEPAGSHGVWGLDDYQFLSFLFGAGQLVGQKRIKPSSITNRELVEAYSPDYLYFAGIEFINKVKKGPFHEHSPILYDISGVPMWEKVNSGLFKMYQAEVLKKVPIMQHFLFGSILSL